MQSSPLRGRPAADNTTAEEIRAAAALGSIAAVKYYPAGATTNSADGVTSISRVTAALEAMAELGLPLLVHGEVTDAAVDIFDRRARAPRTPSTARVYAVTAREALWRRRRRRRSEKAFVDGVLAPLRARLPELRVVLEHITTREAVEYVQSDGSGRLAATVTPQHMLLNRNAMLVGGMRPHLYCLPILKRDEHREAVFRAATSGDRRFFLGTDSAPHARGTKECACGCAGCFSAHAALPLYASAFEQAGALDKLEAFARRAPRCHGALCLAPSLSAPAGAALSRARARSFNGPDFYGRPRNTGRVTLVKAPWEVPAEYTFGDATVVPLMAASTLQWAVASVQP